MEVNRDMRQEEANSCNYCNYYLQLLVLLPSYY